MKKIFKKSLSTALVVSLLLTAGLISASAEEQTISQRMTHHRAIDATVWAMPLMNYKFYRDALVDAGLGPNDIGYFSKVQDWRFQTATPNNTTPYVLTHWTIKDGPIVVEIPASTADVGIFGTLMDAWQRPIDDVGAAGRDKGMGATYLLLPEGYTGPILPNARVYQQRTDNGFAVLRPIIADSSPDNLAKAAEFVKNDEDLSTGPETENKIYRSLRNVA